ISQEVNKKQDWEVTKRYLRQVLSGPFAKSLESLIPLVNNKIAFEAELNKLLGPEHAYLNRLELLKRKWSSILSNIEEYDALKSKFVSSINIVGATANHIAAAKYRDFSFE